MAIVNITLTKDSAGNPQVIIEQDRDPSETSVEHENDHKRTLRALGVKNGKRDPIGTAPVTEGNNPVGTRQGIKNNG